MKPSIPAIYNGDSYIFHLAGDWSAVLIERFANNQNVVAEQMKFDDLAPELRARFEAELRKRQRNARRSGVA